MSRRFKEEVNRCAEFRSKRDEVQRLIDEGWHYHDIAELYQVSHMTVYKEFPKPKGSHDRRTRRVIMPKQSLLTQRW